MERAPGTYRDDAAAAVDDLRGRIGDFGEQAASFIRERPLTVLLAALGVGWLVGRFVR